VLIAAILRDGFAAGKLPAEQGAPVGQALLPDLTAVIEQTAPGVPAPLFARGMTTWIQLFGVVSFEVFGQLNNVIEHRAEFFEYQMRSVARLLGLPD
jgi:hypothetical protein